MDNPGYPSFALLFGPSRPALTADRPTFARLVIGPVACSKAALIYECGQRMSAVRAPKRAGGQLTPNSRVSLWIYESLGD
jgi:hypothetical protein